MTKRRVSPPKRPSDADVVDAALRVALVDIEKLAEPSKMTKEQSRDFLCALIADLQIRLEAVVDELNEEG